MRDERAESPEMRAIAFERGADWQVSYFTGSAGSRAEVAQAVVDDQTGQVLGAWHDQQLDAPLARGYSGAIAQKVNAPYVWLPLCLLFLAPFFDPRRPFRLLHLDLLVLLGLGVSLLFFNRGEITASVPLTYPVLGYVFARMLWVGVRPRDRPGRLIPVLGVRWLAIAALVLACGRIALNVADSHVIDIGVAGVVGADHVTHGAGALQRQLRARASESAATSTGRSTTSPTCRSRRPSPGTVTGATCPRRTRRRSPSTCSRRSACWRSAGDCVPAGTGARSGSPSRSRGSPTRSRSTR